MLYLNFITFFDLEYSSMQREIEITQIITVNISVDFFPVVLHVDIDTSLFLNKELASVVLIDIFQYIC